MFEKILVPLDDTNVSVGIIPVVTELAMSTNAEVVLLTVLDTHTEGLTLSGVRTGAPSAAAGGQMGPVGPVGAPEMTTYQAGPSQAQLDEKAADDANHRLMEFVDKLDEDGVEAATAVKFGTPAESILAAVAEHGCDLIAMSTHARHGLGRILMGSVTEEVIRGSKVPVLTIKPGGV